MRPIHGLLVSIATGIAVLFSWGPRLPEVDIRSIGWRTPLAVIRAEAVPGQVLHLQGDGLQRVDVAISELAQPPSELELHVRDGLEGEILRQVPAASFQPEQHGGWLRFDFEPITDSSARALWLQLVPAQGVEAFRSAPIVRFHGASAGGAPWGDEVFEGPLIEGTLLSAHAGLRGLAFGGHDLQGQYSLVLYDADTGRELRRAEAEVPARAEWGWVFFGFDRLEDSRWKKLGYRLTIPSQASLVGTEAGPARLHYHGSGTVDARLVGLTQGTRLYQDRDLQLRAWTENDAWSAIRVLVRRLGWRLAWIAMCSFAAVALLCLAIPLRGGRARGDQPQQ